MFPGVNTLRILPKLIMEGEEVSYTVTMTSELWHEELEVVIPYLMVFAPRAAQGT
jgi:hypothetical protein